MIALLLLLLLIQLILFCSLFNHKNGDLTKEMLKIIAHYMKFNRCFKYVLFELLTFFGASNNNFESKDIKLNFVFNKN